MMREKLIQVSVILVIILHLFGCGGGGGHSNTETNSPSSAGLSKPIATNASIKYGLRQLVITWNLVSDATYYKVLKKSGTNSSYIELATNISTTTYSDLEVLDSVGWINTRYQISACNASGCTNSAEINALDPKQAISYIKASNGTNGFGWSIALSADGNTLAVGARLESGTARGINGAEAHDFSATNNGAVYIFTRVGVSWLQQAHIKTSHSYSYDVFGTSVALSANGNILVVGAPGDDANVVGVNGDEAHDVFTGATDSGAAFVFTRTGVVWSQQAYIKASNTKIYDSFGESVSLSSDGHTLAVGAPGEASDARGINGDQANTSAYGAGAVYLFTFQSNIWSQQTYIKASNSDGGDYFGRSLTLSGDGNTLAVSALGESSNARGINGDQEDNSTNLVGAAYVFVQENKTWIQQAYIKASNSDYQDVFGTALDLSNDGNTLAVSAVEEGSNSNQINGDQMNNDTFGAGAVYIFIRSTNVWSQQAYLKASNTRSYSRSTVADEFGSSVALSDDGNTLAVGARGEDSNAVGLDGDKNSYLSYSKYDSGAAYLFSRNGNTWAQKIYIKASNTDNDDEFGGTIALNADGTTLAVGAIRENAVYVY